MGILFAFWLVEFDDLSDEDDLVVFPGGVTLLPMHMYLAMKTALVLIFLLVGATSYSWIKMKEFSDPLYDFHEETGVWDFVRIFLLVWGILYFLSLSYFEVQGLWKTVLSPKFTLWFGTLSPCDDSQTMATSMVRYENPLGITF